MNRTASYPILFIAVILGLGCADRIAGTPCPGGQVSVDGTCYDLCNASIDCERGWICEDGVCRASERPGPIISRVNGNGTLDATPGHAPNHIRDALVVEGHNLADAWVDLVGDSASYGDLALSESTPSRLVAMLPAGVNAGTYGLVVTNQFGADQVSVTVLQGEAGADGICDASACNTQTLPGASRVSTFNLFSPDSTNAAAIEVVHNGGSMANSSDTGVFLGVYERSTHQASTDSAHNRFYAPGVGLGLVTLLTELAALDSDHLVVIAANVDLSAVVNDVQGGTSLAEQLIRFGATERVTELQPGETLAFVGYAGSGGGNGALRVAGSAGATLVVALVDDALLAMSTTSHVTGNDFALSGQSCTQVGDVVTGFGADGTVQCDRFMAGTGIDITGATISAAGITGSDIQNGSISFANLAPGGCLAGEVIEWTGSAWDCGADDDSTYTGGAGIVVAGTSISADVSGAQIQNGSVRFADLHPEGCTNGQGIQWNGSVWSCGSISGRG